MGDWLACAKVTFRSRHAKGARRSPRLFHRHFRQAPTGLAPRRRRSTGSNLAKRDWLVSHSSGGEQVVKRLERVLEEGLERVDTPQAARAVVARIEKMSTGHTEAEVGDA